MKITVKPLPEAGKPLGFSGMVGTLTMITSMSTDTLKANDALTYKGITREWKHEIVRGSENHFPA